MRYKNYSLNMNSFLYLYSSTVRTKVSETLDTSSSLVGDASYKKAD